MSSVKIKNVLKVCEFLPFCWRFKLTFVLTNI